MRFLDKLSRQNKKHILKQIEMATTVLPSEQTETPRNASGVPLDASAEKNVQEAKKKPRKRTRKTSKRAVATTTFEPKDDRIHASVVGGTERFHAPHPSMTPMTGNIFSSPLMMEKHLKGLIV